MNDIALFGRITLATVFGLSAVLKLRAFPSFAEHVRATLPVARGLAGPTAAGTVLAEATTAAALLLARPPWLGFGAALALLGAFTVYLAGLLGSGGGVSCGCAGSGGNPVSGTHLIRNLLLALLTGAAWLSAVWAQDGAPTNPLVVAAPAAVAGALLLYLDEIVSFFR